MGGGLTSLLFNKSGESAYPPYYIENPIVKDEDILLCSRGWDCIMSDTPTLPFIAFKEAHPDSRFDYMPFVIFHHKYFPLKSKTFSF